MPNLPDLYQQHERYWPAWLQVGLPWPPPGHGARIEGYKNRKEVFKGNHVLLTQEAWRRLLKGEAYTEAEQKALMVTINLSGELTRFWADLLFGEKPLLQVDLGDDAQGKDTPSDSPQVKAAKAWLEDLEQDNGLQRVEYQEALAQSYRGDALFKVRHSGSDGRPIIEGQNAEFWYPWSNPDNVKEVLSHVIAWERKLSAATVDLAWWQRILAMFGLQNSQEREVTVLRVEAHFKGLIANRLYLLRDGKLSRQLDLDILPGYDAEQTPTEDDTGAEDFLIIHAPNLEIDDQLEGIDDYTALESLQIELDIRHSQNSRILDKHAGPQFYGPKSMAQMNMETGRWEVETSPDGRFLLLDVEDMSNPPGAITWEGHLTDAREHIEQTIDLFLMTAGASRAPWGDKLAGGQEAAAAILRKLMRALATVNRKRVPFDSAIKKAVCLAMQLDKDRRPDVVTWEPFKPQLHWQDGLPIDEDALVKRLETAVTGAIMSREQAVKTQHPSWDDEKVQAELDRIDSEKAAGAVLGGSFMPGANGGLNGPSNGAPPAAGGGAQ